MDELDKILLQHLPDTGLCERSKLKQAQRRRILKLAILGYMMNQARSPNAVVTKEGGVVAIDEMQLDEQDKLDHPIPLPSISWRNEGDKIIVTSETYHSPFIEDGAK